MARQDPLKTIILQARNGLHLLRPGKPADVARSGEASAVAAPPEVVAAEEEFAVQQCAVPPRVSGSRNGEEPGRHIHWFQAFDDAFGVRLRREFVAMDNARGAEARRIFVGIGDVVAVGEKM